MFRHINKYSLLLISFFSVAGYSQESLSDEAARFFEEKNYKQAFSHYSRLLSVYPEDPDFNYRFGVCMLLTDRRDVAKPLKYLTFARDKQVKERELYFYLGLSFHQNMKFEDAADCYRKFLDTPGNTTPQGYHVQRLIENCTNGMMINRSDIVSGILSRSEYEVGHFDPGYPEEGFQGRVFPKPEIFQSSADKIKETGGIIFMPTTKKQLCYASYGDDTASSKDIYFVELAPSGEWSTPVKLGYNVNTPLDEDFPVLADDGMTLYFSSKGHQSMGGYDIFRSVYDVAGNSWGYPENLGYRVNTPFDDYMFVPDVENKNAIFTSDRLNAHSQVTVFRVSLVENPFGNIPYELATAETGKEPQQEDIGAVDPEKEKTNKQTQEEIKPLENEVVPVTKEEQEQQLPKVPDSKKELAREEVRSNVNIINAYCSEVRNLMNASFNLIFSKYDEYQVHLREARAAQNNKLEDLYKGKIDDLHNITKEIVILEKIHRIADSVYKTLGGSTRLADTSIILLKSDNFDALKELRPVLAKQAEDLKNSDIYEFIQFLQEKPDDQVAREAEQYYLEAQTHNTLYDSLSIRAEDLRNMAETKKSEKKKQELIAEASKVQILADEQFSEYANDQQTGQKLMESFYVTEGMYLYMKNMLEYVRDNQILLLKIKPGSGVKTELMAQVGLIRSKNVFGVKSNRMEELLATSTVIAMEESPKHTEPPVFDMTGFDQLNTFYIKNIQDIQREQTSLKEMIASVSDTAIHSLFSTRLAFLGKVNDTMLSERSALNDFLGGTRELQDPLIRLDKKYFNEIDFAAEVAFRIKSLPEPLSKNQRLRVSQVEKMAGFRQYLDNLILLRETRSGLQFSEDVRLAGSYEKEADYLYYKSVENRDKAKLETTEARIHYLLDDAATFEKAAFEQQSEALRILQAAPVTGEPVIAAHEEPPADKQEEAVQQPVVTTEERQEILVEPVVTEQQKIEVADAGDQIVQDTLKIPAGAKPSEESLRKEEPVTAKQEEVTVPSVIEKAVEEPVIAHQEEPVVIPSQNGEEKNILPESGKEAEKPVIIETEIKTEVPGTVIFRVQLAALNRVVDENYFKGIRPVTQETVPGSEYTRYLGGEFDSYEKAGKAKLEYAGKGFNQAFVVAYLNGTRIPVGQALKMQPDQQLAVAEKKSEVEDKPMPPEQKPPEQKPVEQKPDQPVPSEPKPVAMDPSYLNISDVAGRKFFVQIGTFAGPKKKSELYDAKRIYYEPLSDGKIRYFSGAFDTYNESADERKALIAGGASGAFIVAIEDGRKIDLASLNIKPPEKTGSTEEKPVIKQEEKPVVTQGDGIIFRVQLGSFKSEGKPDWIGQMKSRCSRGVDLIQPEPGTYTYTTGSFTHYSEASVYKNELKADGLSGVFVVATSGGKKIDLQEAIRKTGSQ